MYKGLKSLALLLVVCLRTFQIRGLPANSNQKVLFMLDGVPYWMPESGDIPFSGIPLQNYGVSASLRSAVKRQEVDSYYLLNLNYRYKTSKDFTFFSSITNVLDEEIMHSDIFNLTTRNIQAHDGIGLLLSFNYAP